MFQSTVAADMGQIRFCLQQMVSFLQRNWKKGFLDAVRNRKNSFRLLVLQKGGAGFKNSPKVFGGSRKLEQPF
jgi:hypothetical protein